MLTRSTFHTCTAVRDPSLQLGVALSLRRQKQRQVATSTNLVGNLSSRDQDRRWCCGLGRCGDLLLVAHARLAEGYDTSIRKGAPADCFLCSCGAASSPDVDGPGCTWSAF